MCVNIYTYIYIYTYICTYGYIYVQFLINLTNIEGLGLQVDKCRNIDRS